MAEVAGMARRAMAQAAIHALRRDIARIEGILPEPMAAAAAPLRHTHDAGTDSRLSPWVATGAAGFDQTLGGGLPAAALTEVHGAAGRDAGALTGFALALVRRLVDRRALRPLLWVAIGQTASDLGLPYPPGLAGLFGLPPEALLLAEAAKLADGLWIAEEAARLPALAAVILEVEGNPGRLDLTATRRLHRRAQAAGRPVLLLRHSGLPEPTAAPVRLLVAPAAAAPRHTLSGPLPEAIGRPAFTVAIGKSRTALPGTFILEWNPHDSAFQERRPQDSRFVVPASSLGPHLSPALGEVVALPEAAGAAAARLQLARKQHPAHRHARRTG